MSPTEIKEKIFFKRWFCKHQYESMKDIRGFFGITQCVKCGEYSRLPSDKMTISTGKLPEITFNKD